MADHEILLMLARIERAIDALPVRVAEALQTQRGRNLAPDDHARLGALLPIIEAELLDTWWTVGELVAAGKTRPDLRKALAGLSTSELGFLLSRGEGAPIKGIQIQRAPKPAHGGLIRRCVR